jgi:hypothetical protein
MSILQRYPLLPYGAPMGPLLLMDDGAFRPLRIKGRRPYPLRIRREKGGGDDMIYNAIKEI